MGQNKIRAAVSSDRTTRPGLVVDGKAGEPELKNIVFVSEEDLLREEERAYWSGVEAELRDEDFMEPDPEEERTFQARLSRFAYDTKASPTVQGQLAQMRRLVAARRRQAKATSFHRTDRRPRRQLGRSRAPAARRRTRTGVAARAAAADDDGGSGPPGPPPRSAPRSWTPRHSTCSGWSAWPGLIRRLPASSTGSSRSRAAGDGRGAGDGGVHHGGARLAAPAWSAATGPAPDPARRIGGRP